MSFSHTYRSRGPQHHGQHEDSALVYPQARRVTRISFCGSARALFFLSDISLSELRSEKSDFGSNRRGTFPTPSTPQNRSPEGTDRLARESQARLSTKQFPTVSFPKPWNRRIWHRMKFLRPRMLRWPSTCGRHQVDNVRLHVMRVWCSSSQNGPAKPEKATGMRRIIFVSETMINCAS